MGLQVQPRVSRSAGAGHGHHGMIWVEEMIPGGRGSGQVKAVNWDPLGMGPDVIRVDFHLKYMKPCSTGS